jgi:hypothetical protein
MHQPNKSFVQIYSNALRDPSLSCEAKGLLAIISTRVNHETGWTWPRTSLLMREARLTEYKVEQLRSEIVKAGWMEKHFFRDRWGRFSNLSVKYRVSERFLHPPEPKKPPFP